MAISARAAHAIQKENLRQLRRALVVVAHAENVVKGRSHHLARSWEERNRQEEMWERGIKKLLEEFHARLNIDGAVQNAAASWVSPSVLGKMTGFLRKAAGGNPPTPDDQGYTPPSLQELINVLSFGLPMGPQEEGALQAYIGMAAETGVAAGQSALDQMGLHKTFEWAHPRNIPRALYEVRGSKVVQNMYGEHLNRLSQIISDATDPRHPQPIQEVTRQIKEEWPQLESYQAKRIARTETAAVWTGTQANAYMANGIGQVQSTIATGPSIGVETEDPCDECVDAAADVHDLTDDLPPWHPNCRCEIVPVLEDPNTGDLWLPPDEPWTGGELPVCGSPLAKAANRQRTKLLKMAHVTIKKEAGVPGACATPLPEPGEPFGGITYTEVDAGSIDEEAEAAISQLRWDVTSWPTTAPVDAAKKLLDRMAEQAKINDGEVEAKLLVGRTTGGELENLAGYYLGDYPKPLLAVSGAVSKSGGARRIIGQLAAKAYEDGLALAIDTEFISPALKKIVLDQWGFAEYEAEDSMVILDHEHLAETFHIDETTVVPATPSIAAEHMTETTVGVPTAPATPPGVATLDSIIASGAKEFSGKVEVYRVGPTGYQKRGVFFGDSPESVDAYAGGHAGHETQRYIIDLKNVKVYKDARAAWADLFPDGKSFSEAFDTYAHQEGVYETGAMRKIDERIASRLRAKGHDGLVYTEPAPPAKYELAVVKPKPLLTLKPADEIAVPEAAPAAGVGAAPHEQIGAPAPPPPLPEGMVPIELPHTVDEAKARITSTNNKISGVKTRIKKLGAGEDSKLAELQQRLQKLYDEREQLKAFVKNGGKGVEGAQHVAVAPPEVEAAAATTHPPQEMDPVEVVNSQDVEKRAVVPGGLRKESGTQKLSKMIANPAGSVGNKRAVADRVLEELANDTRWNHEVISQAYGYRGRTWYADNPEKDTVASLISNWARTSSDADWRGVAIQQALKDELGLHAEPFAATHWNNPEKNAEIIQQVREQFAQNPKLEDSLKAFVRAQYEATQKFLKEQGIDELTVYRGLAPKGEVPWPVGVSVMDVTDNPAASWSTRISVSKRGHFYGGTMLRASVPREMVLGTPLTGFGCSNEFEVVVLNDAHNKAWVVREGSAKMTDARRQEVALGIERMNLAREKATKEFIDKFSDLGAKLSANVSGGADVTTDLGYQSEEYARFFGRGFRTASGEYKTFEADPRVSEYYALKQEIDSARQYVAAAHAKLTRGVETFHWRTETELKGAIQKVLDENTALAGKDLRSARQIAADERAARTAPKLEITHPYPDDAELKYSADVTVGGDEAGQIQYVGGQGTVATFEDEEKIFAYSSEQSEHDAAVKWIEEQYQAKYSAKVKGAKLEFEGTDEPMVTPAVITIDGDEVGAIKFKGFSILEASYKGKVMQFDTHGSVAGDEQALKEAKKWVKQQYEEENGVKSAPTELTPEKRARNKVSSTKHAIKVLQQDYDQWKLGQAGINDPLSLQGMEGGADVLNTVLTADQYKNPYYENKLAQAQAKYAKAQADLEALLGKVEKVALTPIQLLAKRARVRL